MTPHDVLARRELEQFLSRRRLQAPTGEPLYTYRASADEIAGLRRLLQGVDLPSAEGALAAAFVLFAAETFRTEHRGGAWSWRTVLEPIGLSGSTTLCEPAENHGLRWWRRPVTRRLKRGPKHLFMLVAEGGFPTGLIAHDNGSLQTWLMRVQGFVSSHRLDAEDAAEVAREHSGLIAAALRSEELFALAGELTCAVRALQDILGTSDDEADPLVRLGERMPDWRAGMPIDIEDDAARTLLRGLLRAQRTEDGGSGALVRRILVRDGPNWRPALRFAQAGRFRTDQTPAAAADLLDGNAFRGRLSAAGRLALAYDGELAVLVKSDDVWLFRSTLRDGARLPFALAENALATLRVGERQSAPFTLAGGGAIDDDVLVFVEEADGVLGFVGSGARRVRQPSVHVALDPSATILEPASDSTVEELGAVHGSALVVHRIVGGATIRMSDGLSVRVASGVDDPSGRQVLAFPRPTPTPVFPEPASAGVPSLYYAGGLNVARAHVRWRPSTGGAWTALTDREPVGAVVLAIQRDGELIDRFRLSIVPRDARVTLHARPEGGGEIVLEGFGPCRLALREGAQGVVRHEPDRIVIETPPNLLAREVDATLNYAGSGAIGIRLRTPQRGVAFLDREGRILQNGAELAVTDVAGVRAVAEPGHLIIGELRSREQIMKSFARPLGEELSLASLDREMRALLVETADPDARVRLEAAGARLSVRRYAFELERTEDGRLAPRACPPPRGTDASLRAVAHPLFDPRRGEVVLWEGGGSDLATLTFGSPAPEEPWLAWIESGGRAVSRPGVLLGAVPAPADDRFALCSDLPTMRQRRAAMAQHLEAIASDPSDPDWQKLRASLKLCQGRIPLAALDWFAALVDCPRALPALLLGAPAESVSRVLDLDDELPLLWEALPIGDWLAAAEAQVSRLRAVFGSQGDGLAARLIGDTLRAVAEERPGLAATVRIVAAVVGAADSLSSMSASDGVTSADAAQELMRRNADRQWPVSDAILALAPPLDALAYAPHMHAVIVAPHLARRLALGQASSTPHLLRALRSAKRFDPVYFEAAYLSSTGSIAPQRSRAAS